MPRTSLPSAKYSLTWPCKLQAVFSCPCECVYILRKVEPTVQNCTKANKIKPMIAKLIKQMLKIRLAGINKMLLKP